MRQPSRPGRGRRLLPPTSRLAQANQYPAVAVLSHRLHGPKHRCRRPARFASGPAAASSSSSSGRSSARRAAAGRCQAATASSPASGATSLRIHERVGALVQHSAQQPRAQHAGAVTAPAGTASKTAASAAGARSRIRALRRILQCLVPGHSAALCAKFQNAGAGRWRCRSRLTVPSTCPAVTHCPGADEEILHVSVECLVAVRVQHAQVVAIAGMFARNAHHAVCGGQYRRAAWRRPGRCPMWKSVAPAAHGVGCASRSRRFWCKEPPGSGKQQRKVRGVAFLAARRRAAVGLRWGWRAVSGVGGAVVPHWAELPVLRLCSVNFREGSAPRSATAIAPAAWPAAKARRSSG